MSSSSLVRSVAVSITALGAVALIGLVGARSANAQITLTGVNFYNSSSSGAFGGMGFWNTLGGDNTFNVYLYTGSDGAPVFINSGNGAATSPSLLLPTGSTALNFAGTTSPSQYFGINLYFNGSTTAGISAVVQSGVAGFNVIGSNVTTINNNNQFAPGSSSLTFSSGSFTATLSGLSIANATISGVDLVSPTSTVPDGSGDNRGTLTLSVTSSANAPEPGSFALLSGVLPLIGVGCVVRRRKS